MPELAFMVFGLGFFLFVINYCVSDTHHARSRQDERDDITYNRQLSERREFGYTTQEEHIQPRKSRFSFLK